MICRTGICDNSLCGLQKDFAPELSKESAEVKKSAALNTSAACIKQGLWKDAISAAEKVHAASLFVIELYDKMHPIPVQSSCLYPSLPGQRLKHL